MLYSQWPHLIKLTVFSFCTTEYLSVPMSPVDYSAKLDPISHIWLFFRMPSPQSQQN
jgi:hypothetical protein